MHLRCRSSIALTSDVYDFLAALPDGQYQLPRHVGCDLQDEHDRDHTGFLQSVGEAEETAWWLAWDDVAGTHALVQVPYCCDDCVSVDACLLPEGHPGRHSSELTTVLTLPADRVLVG
ncbi:hypothetical protein [Catellatospora vulcania]|uniref:hypothetical protein n=1 Tax=Catellatospora vulcania TaxID=1460450 RepID=UPI0012D42A33|nr:hypothetical protein [Catellatospora vulcania]